MKIPSPGEVVGADEWQPRVDSYRPLSGEVRSSRILLADPGFNSGGG